MDGALGRDSDFAVKHRYQASRAAVELIKRFEGFRARAARLPNGRWTVGYGHTRTAREGVEIKEADADALLIYDLSAVVAAINEWVFSPLTQNQFDALVAFAFNIGLAAFRRSSVLRRLNEGSMLQAACAMEMWRTADFEGERIVIDALVRRRSAEMALFLTPMEGYIPVPSLIVMPHVDGQAARTGPGKPAEIEPLLEGEWAASMRLDPPEPPSASLAAADAITARLNALLRDEAHEPALAPLELADPDPAPPPQPEAEDDDDPMLGADPGPEQERAAQDEQAAVSGLEREPVTHPALNLRPIAFSASSFGASPPRRGKPRQPPSPLIAAVGVIGLGAASVGMFAGFSANASERLPDPAAAGWGLSLAGAALMASSVYVLLKRLGSRAE